MADYYENIYGYKPPLALALSAAALFGTISFLHTYQTLRSKSWFFTAFVIGGYFECIGFLARAFSIHEGPKYTLPPYAAALALILVAPALFAASIYMLLGRIIRLIQAEYHAIIRIGWLTKIFVLGDVISFVAQAIGAVIISQQTEDSYSRGSNIITIGLAVQILFFGLFIATALLFHFRTVRHPTDRSRHPGIPWRTSMHVLYGTSTIILMRCVFRFVEYRTGGGNSDNGYLLSHEWPMYVLDSLLMFAVMLLFFWKHPSEVTALRQSQGGVTMKYLSTPHVQVNDNWRTLPKPNLGPRMYYEAGNRVVKMTRHPPMGVQVAQANGFRM